MDINIPVRHGAVGVNTNFGRRFLLLKVADASASARCVMTLDEAIDFLDDLRDAVEELLDNSPKQKA